METFGLPKRTFETMYAIFARYPKVEKVVVYGSRAMGNYKTGSDIDLTMYGEYTDSITYNDLSEIAGALDDSDIPYMVDLSIFDQLENAKLREHIERVGKVFYERVAVSWTNVKFEECLEKIKTPQKLQKKNYLEQGKYPVVAQEEALINGYTNDERLLFEVKDTVIIFGDHTRCLKIIDFNFVLGADGVKILKTKLSIDTRFFYYYLSAMMPKSLGYARHFRLLKELSFFIPPLPVQKQIVEKLDAAFADIDKAISATQKNIKNIQNLFDKSVSEIFIENKSGFKIEKLKEVSEYFNGLTYSPKDVSSEGIIVLRSSNIQNNKMDYSDIVRVNKKFKDKLYVQEKDILICSRNGSKSLIGKSSLIGKHEELMIFGTFMMIIRSKFNDYLQWFFISSLFKKQITQGNNTMINQITRYMLDEVIVPFPSIKEQRKISENLSKIYMQTSNLTRIYEKNIFELKSLKSSILNQAFSGELTKEAA